MDSKSDVAPLPPKPKRTSIGSANRRLALLIGLVSALVVFLAWLPHEARLALWTALRAERTLVGILVLFALITLSLLWAAGQRLDTWVFRLFNLRSYHPKWLDRAMWLVTQLGSLGAALAAAFLSFVLDSRRLALEVILGSITLWLVVETIKALTSRARPSLNLKEARIVGWQQRGRSFPSGHTTQTFFLMALLSHQFQLGIGGTVALYALAVLVGFTRIYIGAHYPRDVIGGAALGSVWGILATVVDRYWFGLRF